MYQENGQHFNWFACLYPTAPFITAARLQQAAVILNDQNADGVVSVVKFSFPPQRAFVLRDNRIAFQYPEYAFARSQDLEPIYHDCGQFYFCNCFRFLEMHSLILPDTVPIIIPEEEVQDIDTLSDWKVAEAKYRALYY